MGLTGDFPDDDMGYEQQMQMFSLKRNMKKLMDRERFPALDTIEFLEISSYDILSSVWHESDAKKWKEWVGISKELKIALLDSDGDHISADSLVSFSTSAAYIPNISHITRNNKSL